MKTTEKKKTLYYFESDRGCGIRAARNLQQAEKEIIREVGEYGFERCRKATDQDIGWVKAMGGHIPSR